MKGGWMGHLGPKGGGGGGGGVEPLGGVVDGGGP